MREKAEEEKVEEKEKEEEDREQRKKLLGEPRGPCNFSVGFIRASF